jgi:hypothetical protein
MSLIIRSFMPGVTAEYQAPMNTAHDRRMILPLVAAREITPRRGSPVRGMKETKHGMGGS